MKSIENLLEGYIDNSLTQQEVKSLEHQLQNNIKLVRELALRKELNSLALEDEVETLRDKLLWIQNISENNRIEVIVSSNRNQQFKRIFYAAAAVTGIAFGSWFTMHSTRSQVDAQSLFNENLKTHHPMIILREGVARDFQKQLAQANYYFRNEKFTDAAIQYEVLLINNPESVSVRFYLAISYLHLEEYLKAIDLLNYIIVNESLYTDLAVWYKGLAYIALNDIEAALITLSPLAESEGNIGVKAKELCNQLESLRVSF